MGRRRQEIVEVEALDIVGEALELEQCPAGIDGGQGRGMPGQFDQARFHFRPRAKPSRIGFERLVVGVFAGVHGFAVGGESRFGLLFAGPQPLVQRLGEAFVQEVFKHRHCDQQLLGIDSV